MANSFDPSAFGRFRLLGRIASSPLGPLFTALDERDGRQVSIRFVPPDLIEPARLDRLANVAQREIGSGIAKPIEWGRADVPSLDGGRQQHGFLVTLPIVGEPLSASSFERTEGGWLRVLANVAEVIAASHRADIVHGLLTPDSVFVRDDGTVTVADFGLSARAARLLDRRYVAPEVRERNEPIPQSDQYSLGAIGLELWDRTDQSRARSFAGLEVFERCLNPNPDKRYALTDELAGDLVRLVDNAGELAGQTTLEMADSYPSPEMLRRVRSEKVPS